MKKLEPDTQPGYNTENILFHGHLDGQPDDFPSQAPQSILEFLHASSGKTQLSDFSLL
jgi:hypothetical protein